MGFSNRIKSWVMAVSLSCGLGALASSQGFADGYDQSTISIPLLGGYEVRLSPGQTQTFPLSHRMFVHKLLLQVDSVNGNSGAEVIVNGDRKANMFLQSADPMWVATIEEETSSIQITGLTAQMGHQGQFVIRDIKAVVTDTDYHDPIARPSHPELCNSRCNHLPFPIYYSSVMGNVSNRAIVLTDRLADYANYRDYGAYLLPIKKAAAEARAVAEARGDASQYARPYFYRLLKSLDCSEAYFNDTFERSAAFEMATELLALREHIRDILD
jgi:hypothetical protein